MNLIGQPRHRETTNLTGDLTREVNLTRGNRRVRSTFRWWLPVKLVVVDRDLDKTHILLHELVHLPSPTPPFTTVKCYNVSVRDAKSLMWSGIAKGPQEESLFDGFGVSANVPAAWRLISPSESLQSRWNVCL
jgi:hypothetical protein